MAPAKHLPELDCARCALAWWVVINHCFVASGVAFKAATDPWTQLLMHGDWAVDGFIILSGFVIAKLISEKPEPYLGYISRRFLRLYPVYLICLALAVLLLSPRLDPGLLVSHLALAQGLLTGSGSTAILVPSWSISLEWQYYLIAPAFVAVLWRLRWRWVLVLALVLYLPICRHWDDIFLSHWPMQSFLPM